VITVDYAPKATGLHRPAAQTFDHSTPVHKIVQAETLAAANADSLSRDVAVSASQRLLDRAQKLGPQEWRTSFLAGVPENARTLALAGMTPD